MPGAAKENCTQQTTGKGLDAPAPAWHRGDTEYRSEAYISAMGQADPVYPVAELYGGRASVRTRWADTADICAGRPTFSGFVLEGTLGKNAVKDERGLDLRRYALVRAEPAAM